MWNPKKPPSEKMLIAVVAFLGISALTLGTLQIQNGLKGPFQDRVASEKDQRNDLDIERVNKLSDLQQKDTDKDGLNDFTELYNTRTSPYLRDSDSDGVDDKTEIDAGTDPNCAKGQDCGTPIAVPTQNSNLASVNGVNGGGFTSANTNQTSSISSGNVSPAELRSILIASGAPESEINKLSDAELLRLYGETVSTGSTGQPATNSAPQPVNVAATNGSTNTAIDVTKFSPADLEKLTAPEIRKLMIQFGIPKETLDQVDDASLRDIFLQALKDQQAAPKQ